MALDAIFASAARTITRIFGRTHHYTPLVGESRDLLAVREDPFVLNIDPKYAVRKVLREDFPDDPPARNDEVLDGDERYTVIDVKPEGDHVYVLVLQRQTP